MRVVQPAFPGAVGPPGAGDDGARLSGGRLRRPFPLDHIDAPRVLTVASVREPRPRRTATRSDPRRPCRRAQRHRPRRHSSTRCAGFQMGSAESGSTIKVPVCWPAAAGRPAIVSPTSWSTNTSSPAAVFQDADGDLRDQARERLRPPARPAVQHLQLHRLNDRRQLQRLGWMQLAVERDPLADDPFRACRLVDVVDLAATRSWRRVRGDRSPARAARCRDRGPARAQSPGAAAEASRSDGAPALYDWTIWRRDSAAKRPPRRIRSS